MTRDDRIAEADRRWKAGEDLEAIASALAIRPKEVYFLLRTSMVRRQRELGTA